MSREGREGGEGGDGLGGGAGQAASHPERSEDAHAGADHRLRVALELGRIVHHDLAGPDVLRRMDGSGAVCKRDHGGRPTTVAAAHIPGIFLLRARRCTDPTPAGESPCPWTFWPSPPIATTSSSPVRARLSGRPRRGTEPVSWT